MPLPTAPAAVLAGVEAVLVTHLRPHRFDAAARDALPRALPVFCRPADLEPLVADGFEDVRPVPSVHEWRGLRLVRADFRGARGEAGVPTRAASGWGLSAPYERTLYLIGDTTWPPLWRTRCLRTTRA